MQPRRLSKRSVLGNKLGTAKASSKCGTKETLPARGTGSSAGHGRGEEEEDEDEEIDVVQDEEAPRPSCPRSVRCPYQVGARQETAREEWACSGSHVLQQAACFSACNKGNYFSSCTEMSPDLLICT